MLVMLVYLPATSRSWYLTCPCTSTPRTQATGGGVTCVMGAGSQKSTVRLDGGLVGLRVIAEQPAGGAPFPEIIDPVVLIEALRRVGEPDGPVAGDVERIREPQALPVYRLDQDR